MEEVVGSNPTGDTTVETTSPLFLALYQGGFIGRLRMGDVYLL